MKCYRFFSKISYQGVIACGTTLVYGYCKSCYKININLISMYSMMLTQMIKYYKHVLRKICKGAVTMPEAMSSINYKKTI